MPPSSTADALPLSLAGLPSRGRTDALARRAAVPRHGCLRPHPPLVGQPADATERRRAGSDLPCGSGCFSAGSRRAEAADPPHATCERCPCV
eukprot:7274505-Prymnesium_polylepis.1